MKIHKRRKKNNLIERELIELKVMLSKINEDLFKALQFKGLKCKKK